MLAAVLNDCLTLFGAIALVDETHAPIYRLTPVGRLAAGSGWRGDARVRQPGAGTAAVSESKMMHSSSRLQRGHRLRGSVYDCTVWHLRFPA